MAATPVTPDALDPLIHVPARLRIVATLAALPDGDALAFTRLQEMIELTAGNLITHLRKLEDAGYVSTVKTGNGPASRTSVALTHRGRAALEAYTETLRDLLGGLDTTAARTPAPPSRSAEPRLPRTTKRLAR
ncbi:MAG: transcriptional regulator [Solirubrobacteraceae bacterium]